jgi:uncharacterized protein
MNVGMIANTCWAPAALLLLALPALRRPGNARWIAVVVFVAFADSISTLLPIIDKQLQFANVHWNWAGKLIDIAVMLAVALGLAASGAFRLGDFGFALRQAPGTGRALLFMALPFLLVMAALTATLFGNTKPPLPETLYYEATLPGLAEEIVWRGIQLALFDRMFLGRARIGGAELGYGAIAVSLVFGLVHAVQFDAKLVLHTEWLGGAFAGATGLVLVWLRVRSKSLVFPMLTHNATNLILEAVPRLM